MASILFFDPDIVGNPPCCTCLSNYVSLYPLSVLLKLFSTRSFFSIPRNDDPEPCLLFAGLDIESRQDICVKHMGKYPVLFCDFQVRVYSIHTFQTNCLCIVGCQRQFLGGNAFRLQKLSFQPLYPMGRFPHTVSKGLGKDLF